MAYGIGLVSYFMNKLGRIHWYVAKWLLRYIKETSKLKLMYKANANKSCKVASYYDFDFVGDLDKRASISHYVFVGDVP